MKKEKSDKTENPAVGKKRGGLRTVLASALAFVFAFALAAAGFAVGWVSRYAALDERDKSLLWAIDTAQEQFYREVDEDELYEKLFSAFALDDYSCYYTSEEYAAVKAQNEGSGVGYGFSLTTSGNYLTVYYVVENSPAQASGLRKGMYIFGYGDTEEAGETGTAAQLIAFAASASVLFLRCGESKDGSDSSVIEISPAAYTAAYCTYRDSETSYGFRGASPELTETEDPSDELDDKTAYIRIDQFFGSAAEEFASLLAVMKERGRENLILDLRSNGGGYLDLFLKIGYYLIKEGGSGKNVLASAQYRNGDSVDFTVKGSGYYDYFNENSVIKILADEYTASASECLIGALVDYGTVGFSDIVLRGDTGRTFGKGIMQNTFADTDGNVLKLTVAEIKWPSGSSIHGKGVTVADGALAVGAPLVWGREDAMLSYAARLFG